MDATKPADARTSSRVPVRRSADVRETIRRRSASVYARTRVSEAIRALALDICGGEEGLSIADRANLRQWLSSPVNEATEEALSVLVDELAGALDHASPRLRLSMLGSAVSRTDFE